MAWSKDELNLMAAMGKMYRQWIADMEAGNAEYIAERRVLGVRVDDRDETLARFKENADEIDAILEAAGHA